MITGSCHCGAVRVTVPRRPSRLTACNCSICRRIGALWAYYRVSDVTFVGHPGRTTAYAWGEKTLRIVRCRRCGCVMHWEPIGAAARDRMGVNARNFEPQAIESARIRRLDGASTWKFLD
jgi:hypothetical protein